MDDDSRRVARRLRWDDGDGDDADPDLDAARAALTRVAVEPVRDRQNVPLERRRLLWRDSASILVVVVVTLLAVQMFGPQQTALVDGSPSPIPSGFAISSFDPLGSVGPDDTFGPIVDPSLGIDATPTPARTPRPTPEPTLPPGATPRPTPRPTVTPKPSKTLSPTPPPTAPPTPPPTAPPTAPPTPRPTPPPDPPVSAFSCTELPGLVLDCSNASTGATSWLWDWDDGTQDTGPDPAPHTYATDISPVTVRLTVTGPGGSNFVTHLYTLVP